MILIDIQGDQRIIGILDQAQKRIENPKAALEEVGGMVVSEFEANFPSEGKRLNEPWAKLKQATIKERIRQGYGASPMLVRTGKLMRGFKKEVQTLYVRIYNTIDYFKYHQRGDGNLPQRRMILSPEKLKQEIVAVIAKYVKTVFD